MRVIVWPYDKPEVKYYSNEWHEVEANCAKESPTYLVDYSHNFD